MGTRENKVERYLDEEITLIGGITRKWVSPGRDGVPDRIIILEGMVIFVEVKTIEGKLSSVQSREHARLTDYGAEVHAVYGTRGVDLFVNQLRRRVTCLC